MIIYGASGHGKVICDVIKSQNLNAEIIFVDDAEKGNEFYGLPLLHTSQLDISHDKLIIAIGNNMTRKRIAINYSKYGRAIHSSAIISDTCSIGEGTVIMANSCCNADSQIGKHVILNTACSVDHDCMIGDYTHISPNASIAGNVNIGLGAHIGIGASIIQGINIGKFATVGAGSVVIRDVPDYATVVGCPAKVIKINSYE